MICVNCKYELRKGDWVVQEYVNGFYLPLYHKYCVERIELSNAVHRGEVKGIFQFDPETYIDPDANPSTAI